MKVKTSLIKLEDYRVKDDKKGTISKVFTGRDRGQKVRIDSDIDNVEANSELVKVIIPKNIYSINPSFFEELFVNVVSKLGRDKFMDKFEFVSEGDYNYAKPLSEAIDRILRTNTALD